MIVAKGNLAEDVRRVSAAPLHSCLVQNKLFECGAGMVFLIRKTGQRRLALAGFLVDAYCLGVKDALFREIEEAEIQKLLHTFERAAPFEGVAPSYARKLLRYVPGPSESPTQNQAAARPPAPTARQRWFCFRRDRRVG